MSSGSTIVRFTSSHWPRERAPIGENREGLGGHLYSKMITEAVMDMYPRIRGGLPPRVLRRVREYIETHLEESISIQVLASITGLSMYHFARAFKRSEGMTPHEYLVQRSIRQRGPAASITRRACSRP